MSLALLELGGQPGFVDFAISVRGGSPRVLELSRTDLVGDLGGSVGWGLEAGLGSGMESLSTELSFEVDSLCNVVYA